MAVVYAVGLTHHTGGQLIRTAAILQLRLGNTGRRVRHERRARSRQYPGQHRQRDLVGDRAGYLRIPAEPRLLDLIRNADEEDDRSDLALAQG